MIKMSLERDLPVQRSGHLNDSAIPVAIQVTIPSHPDRQRMQTASPEQERILRETIDSCISHRKSQALFDS